MTMDTDEIERAVEQRRVWLQDWQHSDSYLAGRRLRGEVMTLAPESTIAPAGVLFDDPHLSESWWADLSAALGALAAHPVNSEHELGAVRYTINGVRQHVGITLKFFCGQLGCLHTSLGHRPPSIG